MKLYVGVVSENREENRRFPIPNTVKFQLVIAHDLPELGDVQGGQPGAAGDQNILASLRWPLILSCIAYRKHPACAFPGPFEHIVHAL